MKIATIATYDPPRSSRMQFSLRELLTVVLVASLVVAALVRPGPMAAVLVSSATLLLLLAAVIFAAKDWRGRRWFWCGFAIAGGAYLAFAYLPDRHRSSPRNGGPELTTQCLRLVFNHCHRHSHATVFESVDYVTWGFEPLSMPPPPLPFSDQQFFRIGHCAWALLFGWIAGHVLIAVRSASRTSHGPGPVRFSLRELLGLVVAAAFTAAALVRASELAESLFFSVTLLMVLGAILFAVGNWGGRRWFWCGFAFAGGAYLAFAHLPDKFDCSPREFGPEWTTQSLEWFSVQRSKEKSVSTSSDPPVDRPAAPPKDSRQAKFEELIRMIEKLAPGEAEKMRAFFRIGHCAWALLLGWIAGHALFFVSTCWCSQRQGRGAQTTEHSPAEETPAR